jgi:hypothetical protein
MAVIVVLCLLFALGPSLAAQDGERDSVPEALRQPQLGEAPRYPQDLIIGSLARGDVPSEARRFAAAALAAMVAGNRDAPSLSALPPMVLGELLSALEETAPRRYRIGEGRAEPDGSYSFLVRFLGRDRGIAGELYLRFEAARDGEAAVWRLDDLLLEESRALGEVEQGPTYNLPPYERLF